MSIKANNTCFTLAMIPITAACASSFSSFANDDMHITEHTLQNPPSVFIDSFAFTDSTSQWHHELKQRIDKLSNHQDGWKGPESIAPNADATRYANEFLEQLVNVNIKNQPMVGLDYEGTFSFCWNDDQVSGDLTVYDNGTYSFFISNNRGRTASAEEDRIGDPLNTVFLEILNS